MDVALWQLAETGRADRPKRGDDRGFRRASRRPRRGRRRHQRVGRKGRRSLARRRYDLVQRRRQSPDLRAQTAARGAFLQPSDASPRPGARHADRGRATDRRHRSVPADPPDHRIVRGAGFSAARRDPAAAAATDPAEDGLPLPQRHWAIATLATGIVVSVLDSSIANIALPTIARQLGATPSQSIWVVNAYQLAVVVSLLPFASLGDIFGYRRVYM